MTDPSGNALRASLDEWKPWFAWYPVEVDAYTPAEIKNGHTRYKVHLRMVEWKRIPAYWSVEQEDDIPSVIRYRLPQRTET